MEGGFPWNFMVQNKAIEILNSKHLFKEFQKDGKGHSNLGNTLEWHKVEKLQT